MLKISIPYTPFCPHGGKVISGKNTKDLQRRILAHFYACPSGDPFADATRYRTNRTRSRRARS
jgi:hypothetical protein